MRCLRPRPSALFFRLFIAASAFALGLAAWGLFLRPDAPAAPAATSCGAPDLVEVTMSDTPGVESEDEAPTFEGTYVNHTYGYSVRIPAGLVGLGATPPAPQHGFGIDLDHPRSTAWISGTEFPKSYVYVDGSYNSLGWERLDEAVNSNVKFLHEKGRHVRVKGLEQTRLGGLPAARVVTYYEQDGTEMVSDEVTAFKREEDGAVSVVYTLGLSTPRSKYERDGTVLEAMRQGWYLQPVE